MLVLTALHHILGEIWPVAVAPLRLKTKKLDKICCAFLIRCKCGA